jgi:hypothetical protein
MIKEFKQKRKFNYRKHTLYEDKVVVEYKTAKQTVKYEVKIDQIGYDIQYERENSIHRKVTCLFFLIAPIIAIGMRFFIYHKFDYATTALLFGMSYFLAFLIYMNEDKDDLFLIGQKNLVFYRGIPSENEVLEFIDLVISISKKYFKSKYLIMDNHITEDEFIARLNWLLEMKIITSDELIDLNQDFKVKRLLN